MSHLTDVVRDESQRELLNWIRDTAQKLRDGCALTMAPVAHEHQREACDKIFTFADALLSGVGRKAYHRTNRNGETIWVSADFAQASSPIYAACTMRGSKPEEHEWRSVPFQVADARHSPTTAISLVRSYWK